MAIERGRIPFAAFQQGTPSFWSDERLVVGGSGDRRGGGRFFKDERNLCFSGKIFFLNGPVKDGGGIYLYNCRNVVITRCVFILNFAKWGGALYLERCVGVEVKKNLFIGNVALRDGGAVSVSHSREVSLINNIAVLNVAFRSCPSYEAFKSVDVTFRR